MGDGLIPKAVLVALLGVLCFSAPAFADGGPIMPLSQVTPGMDCVGETVIQGTTISSFNVHVIDIMQEEGIGPRILVSVSGPAVDATGIAEGFSGSPVYCPDSSGTMENAGAISATVGQYGNKVGLVTPIQQMLGEPVQPPKDAREFKGRARLIASPLTVTGLSPSLAVVLERAGRRAGRTIVAAPPAGPPASFFGIQDLQPGASVAAEYSVGAVGTGAIGTVTYRDGDNVYAFGHELDAAGRRSLLLEDAYVYYVVGDPNPNDQPASYKLAAPGHELGILTSDTPNAIIGQVGALPPLIPITVTAHDLDTNQTISESTQVADETDIGLPLGNSILDTVAPLAVGQAAIDVFNGPPALESGSVCLRITLRESAKPLGFCRRYVGQGAPGDAGPTPPELASGAATDVGTALAVLDRVQFAALHVTGITATVNAERGLAEGRIVTASAPHIVRPGGRIPVRLTVRMFRGALRTVSFRLRVPRHVRRGIQVVQLRGASFQLTPSGGGFGSSALSSLLTISLSGGSGSSSPSPKSIADVRSQITAIANFDGVSASFGGPARHVYRDPGLLISGRAMLVLDVR